MDDMTNRLILDVAGLKVSTPCKYPQIANICRDFTAPEDTHPDFSIDTDACDLAFESNQMKKEHGENVIAPDWLLESSAIHRKISRTALAYSRLMMHGSSLSYKGEGVIFTALSGTGKSTHTSFWRSAFGEDVRMINDDKPFLDLSRDTPMICGSPWMGKHHLGENISCPLRAIVIVERAERDRICKVSFSDAVPEIYRQIYRGENTSEVMTALSLMDRISKVPVYRLGCTISEHSAVMARDMIFGEQ